MATHIPSGVPCEVMQYVMQKCGQKAMQILHAHMVDLFISMCEMHSIDLQSQMYHDYS